MGKSIKNILDIYIDTTIPNYVFNEHTPDKQKAAKRLFEEAQTGRINMFSSQVLINELSRAKEPKRSSMLHLVANFPLLETVESVELLAQKYIEQGIIPKKNIDDSRHIALASFYDLDAIVSYNFEHIVRVGTIDGVTAVNLLNGCRTPKIIIPEEVIDVESF